MLKKCLYGIMFLFLFVGLFGGVEAQMLTCEKEPAKLSTQIGVCPIKNHILNNPSATTGELTTWTEFASGYDPSSGDYGEFICPDGVDAEHCPYGIARRDDQCTCDSLEPTQTVDGACVIEARLVKLMKIAEQGDCDNIPAALQLDANGDPINEDVWSDYQEALGISIEIDKKEKPDNIPSDVEETESEELKNEGTCDPNISSCPPGTEKAIEDSVGDPIDLSRGEFTYNNTLISVPSKGKDFIFNITYKNQAEYDGIMGYNRDHNWNKFIVENGDQINYYNGNLEVYTFQAEGSVRKNINDMEITQQGDTYILEDIKTQEKLYFKSQHEDIEPMRITKYQVNGVEYTMEYDELGYLTTITDPNNRDITLEYIEEGQLEQKILSKVIHPIGKELEISHYDNFEDLGLDFDIKDIQITNQGDTRTVEFEYDTDVTYLYDDEGNVVDILVNHELSHNMTQMTDSKDQDYVETNYNDDDRVQSQRYGDYDGSFVYQTNGDRITKTTTTNRKGEKMEYTYDENSNLVEIYDVNSNQRYTITNNAFQTASKVVNADGTEETYEYDSEGNLVKMVINPPSHPYQGGDLPLEINYEYNSNNQLTSVIGYDGIKREFSYNSESLLVGTKVYSTYGNESLTTQYEYTTTNKVSKIILPDGQEIEYSYNQYDRPTQITRIGADNQILTINIEYDINGNASKITDPRGNDRAYEYNEWNLLTKSTTAEGIVSNYEYDENNNLKSSKTVLQNGDKARTNLDYNVLDKTTQIEYAIDQSNSSIINMEYDPNDNLKNLTNPEGTKRNYEYNSLQNITKKWTQIQTTQGTQTISYEYIYDTATRIIEVIDPKGYSSYIDYNWDGTINRIRNEHGTYSQFEYNDKLLLIGKKTLDQNDTLLEEYSFGYDNRNRLVDSSKLDSINNTETSTQIEYDLYGKVINSVDNKGGENPYEYDGFARISKTTDLLGNETSYTYDENGNVVKVEMIPPTPLNEGGFIAQCELNIHMTKTTD